MAKCILFSYFNSCLLQNAFANWKVISQTSFDMNRYTSFCIKIIPVWPCINVIHNNAVYETYRSEDFPKVQRWYFSRYITTGKHGVDCWKNPTSSSNISMVTALFAFRKCIKSLLHEYRWKLPRVTHESRLHEYRWKLPRETHESRLLWKNAMWKSDTSCYQLKGVEYKPRIGHSFVPTIGIVTTTMHLPPRG